MKIRWILSDHKLSNKLPSQSIACHKRKWKSGGDTLKDFGKGCIFGMHEASWWHHHRTAGLTDSNMLYIANNWTINYQITVFRSASLLSTEAPMKPWSFLLTYPNILSDIHLSVFCCFYKTTLTLHFILHWNISEEDNIKQQRAQLVIADKPLTGSFYNKLCTYVWM